jgi:hypothetical protein
MERERDSLQSCPGPLVCGGLGLESVVFAFGAAGMRRAGLVTMIFVPEFFILSFAMIPSEWAGRKKQPCG